MAGGSRLIHAEEDRVAIAVEPDLGNALLVARGFPLAPQGLTAATVIVGQTGGQRSLERLSVGVGHHEDVPRPALLGDHGDQSIGTEPHRRQPAVLGHREKLPAPPAIVKALVSLYLAPFAPHPASPPWSSPRDPLSPAPTRACGPRHPGGMRRWERPGRGGPRAATTLPRPRWRPASSRLPTRPRRPASASRRVGPRGRSICTWRIRPRPRRPGMAPRPITSSPLKPVSRLRRRSGTLHGRESLSRATAASSLHDRLRVMDREAARRSTRPRAARRRPPALVVPPVVGDQRTFNVLRSATSSGTDEDDFVQVAGTARYVGTRRGHLPR